MRIKLLDVGTVDGWIPMESVERRLYAGSCFYQDGGGAVLTAAGWKRGVADSNAVEDREDGTEPERLGTSELVKRDYGGKSLHSESMFWRNSLLRRASKVYSFSP
jgi:hypothetical protein